MKYSDLGDAFNRYMKIKSIQECNWSGSLMVRWQLTDQAFLDRNLQMHFLYTCNCQMASFLDLRLFLYFTLTPDELYIFHLYLIVFIFIIS